MTKIVGYAPPPPLDTLFPGQTTRKVLVIRPCSWSIRLTRIYVRQIATESAHIKQTPCACIRQKVNVFMIVRHDLQTYRILCLY